MQSESTSSVKRLSRFFFSSSHATIDVKIAVLMKSTVVYLITKEIISILFYIQFLGKVRKRGGYPTACFFVYLRHCVIVPA